MNVYHYIIGDSRKIDRIFKAENIGQPDLIITSPPYFNVKNYGDSDGQIGFGQTYEEYLRDLRDVFQKCYELSSPHASFWMITDTIKRNGVIVPLPFDINQELIKNFSLTWKLKETIIWNKSKNIPWHSRGNFKNHFEYVFFYVKDSKYKFNIDHIREISDLKKWWLTYPERYNPKGKAPSNVWEIITPIRGWGKSYLNHFCPFPFPLVEKIISISTDQDDLVFDPFAGSGSVLAIAYVMNRNSVGIDINKEYKKRFREEVLVGAKQYWLRRERELSLNRQKIEQFRLINNKLRKNKLAAIVTAKIKSNYAHSKEPVLLALENSKNKNIINCIIVRNKNGINISPIANDKEIRKLMNVFKININWITTSQEDILESLSGTTFYKYDLANIHQYISNMTLKEIIAETNKRDYFYSNIRLNISKANDLFRKDIRI